MILVYGAFWNCCVQDVCQSVGSCTRHYTNFKINKKNIITHQITQANSKLYHIMMCTQASLYTDYYYQYIVGFKTAAFAHGSILFTRKHTESASMLFLSPGSSLCLHGKLFMFPYL
jgi:hypothetical protein